MLKLNFKLSQLTAAALTLALFAGIHTSTAVSAGISATDLLPPSRGGSEKISEPDQVKVEEDLVVAASAQDAVNAAVEANVESLQEDPEEAETTPEIGARWIRFPSGAGVVATGQAIYTTKTNPTASRIDQRNAYVVAYTNAKAAMARQLGTISNEGKTVLKTVAEQIDTESSSSVSTSDSLNETIEQTVSTLLKGYVTYSIKEEVDASDSSVRFVYVTIASTPKTQKTVVRNGAMQNVDTLLTGIQEVLDEVQSGIVPPVGGRVVVVPATGETAFIAFGTSIVRSSPNRVLAAKAKLNSQKIAAVRARDALVGMIDGDKTIWSTGVASGASKEFQQTLNYAQENDPLNSEEAVDETINNFQEEFLSSESVQEEIQSIRRGTLPPGIQEKHWNDDEGHWAYSMVVYYPAVSDKAKQFAKSMRDATLKAPVKIEEAKSRSLKSRIDPLSGGQVSPDSDL